MTLLYKSLSCVVMISHITGMWHTFPQNRQDKSYVVILCEMHEWIRRSWWIIQKFLLWKWDRHCSSASFLMPWIFLLAKITCIYRGGALCFVSELTLKSWRNPDRDVSDGWKLHYDSPQKLEIFVSYRGWSTIPTHITCSRICNLIFY